MEKGMMIVISGPKGIGNDALARMVAADSSLNAERAVSATTRPPREFEEDKRDFHFVNRKTFNAAFESGLFIETDIVDKWQYGTLKSEVGPRLAKGVNVVLDVSVHAATSLIRRFDCGLMLSVFVTPSEKEYRRILTSTTTGSIRSKVTKYRDDNMFRGLFDFVIESDNLQASSDQIRTLIHTCLAGGGKPADWRKGTVIRPEGSGYEEEK